MSKNKKRVPYQVFFESEVSLQPTSLVVRQVDSRSPLLPQRVQTPPERLLSCRSTFLCSALPLSRVYTPPRASSIPYFFIHRLSPTSSCGFASSSEHPKSLRASNSPLTLCNDVQSDPDRPRCCR